MAKSKVFGFISALFENAGAEIFFALTAGALTICFFACLFLSVFKRGYGLKKRLWFPVVVLICVAICKLRATVTGEEDVSALFLFLGAAFFMPVYFVREKPLKTRDNNRSAREYVRVLENKIKNADGYENCLSAERERRAITEPEILKAKQERPTETDKLDFSHVKNVLQRLEPALLTYADRRQIHELELSLYEAENGGYSEETRRKINEGLGNLLKIMARHGV